MKYARASGFTVIELAVTLAISSILLYTITAAVNSTVGYYKVNTASMDLEIRGNRTMRRIVRALRGTDLDSIAALPAPPFSAPGVLYQTVLPYEEQQAPMSPPRAILRDPTDGNVVWMENPGLADERASIWCEDIPPLFEGEELNGLDDNGNGLIDEAGLYFASQGSSILIGLTLTDGDNTRTWRTQVVCRN